METSETETVLVCGACMWISKLPLLPCQSTEHTSISKKSYLIQFKGLAIEKNWHFILGIFLRLNESSSLKFAITVTCYFCNLEATVNLSWPEKSFIKQQYLGLRTWCIMGFKMAALEIHSLSLKNPFNCHKDWNVILHNVGFGLQYFQFLKKLLHECFSIRDYQNFACCHTFTHNQLLFRYSIMDFRCINKCQVNQIQCNLKSRERFNTDICYH